MSASKIKVPKDARSLAEEFVAAGGTVTLNGRHHLDWRCACGRVAARCGSSPRPGRARWFPKLKADLARHAATCTKVSAE